MTGGLFAAGLQATGQVRALRARIERHLGLQDAVLRNEGGNALSLDGVHVAGGLFAAGLEATGEVGAVGARVEGQLDLPGAVLTNNGGDALNLQGAHVSHLFSPALGTGWVGALDLTSATIEVMDVGPDPSMAPAALTSAGWELGEVHGFLRDDSKAFAAWLDTAPQFAAQPWAAVAAFYDRAGQPGHARKLRVEMEKRATASLSPVVRWLRHVFYGGTVGYGYHPFRALWWLLGLGLVAATIAWYVPEAFTRLDAAAGTEVPQTASAETQQGRPHAGIVALETVLPAAATVTVNPWQPTEPWVQAVLTAFKTSSWLLAALFLAGVTGLLRRRTT